VIPEQLQGCKFIKVRPRAKAAEEAGWKTTANYTADDHRLINWIEKDGGNYGVMVAGGICVLDADDVAAVTDDPIFKYFLNTFTVRTGRKDHPGAHFYFRCSGLMPDKYPVEKAGVDVGDIRSSGSKFFTVGPGSIHPSGKRYEVINDAAPIEIPVDVLQDFITRYSPPAKPKPAMPDRVSSKRSGSISDALGLSVMDFLQPGDAATHGDEIQGAHPIHGSDTGENFTVNVRKNTWHCFRHGTGGGPLEAMAVAAGIIECGDAGPGCIEDHWRDVFMELEARGYELNKEGKETPPEAPQGDADDSEQPDYSHMFTVTERGPRPIYPRIADHLISLYDVISFNRRIYIYTDGVYQADKTTIPAKVREILRGVRYEGSISNVLREVMEYVHADRGEAEYPFNTEKGLIPLKNGVFEISTGNLLDHDPGYRFAYKVDVSYNQDIDTAPVMEILDTWLSGSNTPGDLLLQIPAQALLQATGFGTFKLAYILEGEKNAGKSSACDLILNVIGDGNHAEVDLQSLLTNKFANAALEAKLLNCVDDLETVPLSHIGMFKKLTGSYYHQIERKGVDSYPGKIHAVHLFSCNQPPKLKQNADDMAFWDRFNYILFVNTFEPDPLFTNVLESDEIKEGFLKLILDRVMEITANPATFTRQDPYDVREMWLQAGDDVYRFINEVFDVDQTLPKHIEKDLVFRCYLKWCEKENIRPLTLNRLSRELQNYGIDHKGRHKIGGKQVMTYDGLDWKEGVKKPEPQDREVEADQEQLQGVN